MPRLSVYLIRAALVYLAAGFTLGALLLTNKGLDLSPWVWRLLPMHIEFLLLGWTLQLAMGMAFWILPRFRSARGNVRAAWLAFILLNGGIWLVSAGPWVAAWPWLAPIGRLIEAAAVVAFAVHAWPRVKPIGA